MGKKKRMKIDGRTYRGTLDKFLADKQLKRKPIAKDGSCLFRAVAEQVYSSQCYHQDVRLRCVEYISTHKDDFKEFITVSLDEYLMRLSKELWGGEVELVVLSRLYNRSIVVYNELAKQNTQVQEQVFPSFEDEEKGSVVDKLTNPILLAYFDGNHYDSVYTVQYMDNLSFCQGILYTAMMEGVFKDIIPQSCKKKLMQLQQLDLEGIAKSRQEKYSVHREQEAKALYNLGHHYGTEEIQALSWTFHYNAALCVHNREKENIEQRDRSMAASIQFSVGDKCYFHIDGKRMTGEIAALSVKPGQHSVRIHQSEDETWQIPINDIMLTSANRKSHQRHNHHNSRSSSSANSQTSQHKRRSSPHSSAPVTNEVTADTPQSNHSSTPVTVHPSVPYSASRKGRVSSSTLQPQSTEKGVHEKSKRKQGNNAPPPPTETSAQQARKTKSSGKSTKASHASSPQTTTTTSSGVVPLQASDSTPKVMTTTGYSSAVKKTAGGPSGSLTSEGTEYDESSGEEGAQEENEPAPPEITKFPQQQVEEKQQQQQHHQQQRLLQQEAWLPSKSNIPLLHGIVNPLEGGGQERKMVKNEGYKSSAKVTAVMLQQQQQQEDTSPQLTFQTIHSDAAATPPRSQQNGRESPYFERQIPQEASSQPEDAWPLISDDQPCNSVPPPNTMLFAAAMTNRINHDQTFPIPFSAGPNKADFSNVFSIQHTPGRISSNPPALLPLVMSQSDNVSNSSHISLPLNVNLLEGSLSSPTASSARETVQQQTHHHFHAAASSAPLLYGMSGMSGNFNNTTSHSSTEVYNTAAVNRNLSLHQAYTPSFDKRMSGTPSYPFTTMAAGMEMRNMLGIHGNHQVSKLSSSTSSPVYCTKNRVLMSSGYLPPTSRDNFVQTSPLSCYHKEAQVGPSVMEQGSQTTTPQKTEMGIQTSEAFIPLKEISPPEMQMQSTADRILFAIKYSLQCLSAFSQSDNAFSIKDLETSLGELLIGDRVDHLINQHTAQVSSNLTASQQELLKSFPIRLSNEQSQPMPDQVQMAYRDNLPSPTPQSPVSAKFNGTPVQGAGGDANSGKSEDFTPQQEQHLPSPVLGVHPPNFPMMMPRPPFILPHTHPIQPMYYPLMPHMPMPPVMGYMPFLRPMVPHPPPPPGVSGEVVIEKEADSDLVCTPPDNAHQEAPLSTQDESEANSNMTSVDHNVVPAQAQSEVVASMYSVVPSATSPSHDPPEEEVTEIRNKQFAGPVPVPQSQSTPRLPNTVSPLPTDPNRSPLPVVVATSTTLNPSTCEKKEESTRTDTLVDSLIATESSLDKPPMDQPPPTETSRSQPKTFKSSKRSHGNSDSRKGGHMTTTSSQPGLPCRPSGSQSTITQGSRYGGKHVHPRGQGEGQKRTNTAAKKLETAPKNRNGGSGRGGAVGSYKKSKTEEASSNSGGGGGGGRDGSKESISRKGSSNEHSSRSHTERNQHRFGNSHSNKTPKRYATGGDHTGTTTVSGPSINSSKSNQDSSRYCSHPYIPGMDRLAVNTASNSLDTKEFKWGMPSPSNPDVIIDSTSGEHSLPMDCQDEWPDVSELANDTTTTHPISFRLKFIDGDWKNGDNSEDSEFIKQNNREYEQYSNTESLEDPFNMPELEGTWNSDVGDLPLSFSISQNRLPAQCTSDMHTEPTERANWRPTDFHKH